MSGTGWNTPWALGTVLMMAACGVADLVLRKRYAAGSGERDQKTTQMLVLSLNLNVALLLALPALGVGLIPPELVRVLGPIGFVGSAFGLGLRYGAIWSLGRRFTWQVSILDGHELQEEGVFSLIRHPSYSGGLLALAFAPLALGCWPPLLVVALTHLPITLHRIQLEERVLGEHFGSAYQDYQRRTYRLIPFVY
jgi:protein-S-isoprenylcysteine O-methyltransferase Ste14